MKKNYCLLVLLFVGLPLLAQDNYGEYMKLSFTEIDSLKNHYTKTDNLEVKDYLLFSDFFYSKRNIVN
jgi:hypothetical protein